MTVEDRVRQFLIDRGHWDGAPDDLTDHLPLIEGRVIDSLGIQRLIAFVERQFGIEVGDGDVVPENFETIASLATFVRRQQAATARPAAGGRDAT
jgi:acyl carrier protein